MARGAVKILSKVMSEGTQEGVFVFMDGSRYEGQYIQQDSGEMVRHGTGTFSCGADGIEQYQGSWKNDKMYGKGEFKFASGALYKGSFVDNLFDGDGKYTWSDGATYTGSWKESKMHGNGKYIDTEHVAWKGKFYNGKYFNGKTYIIVR